MEKDFAQLAQHYDQLVARYGDDPRSAQQADLATQERRLSILSEICDPRKLDVLDFGCGTGQMLRFLQDRHAFEGTYVGWDIAPAMIELARRLHPEGRFECGDCLQEGALEPVDVAFVSGTFNNRISDNWGFVTTALRKLYPFCRVGIAFNLLSRYVDYFDEGLYYADPEEVFRFCKEELSGRVALRHDYLVREASMPYEFTIYVYRDDSRPRHKKAP